MSKLRFPRSSGEQREQQRDQEVGRIPLDLGCTDGYLEMLDDQEILQRCSIQTEGIVRMKEGLNLLQQLVT